MKFKYETCTLGNEEKYLGHIILQACGCACMEEGEVTPSIKS